MILLLQVYFILVVPNFQIFPIEILVALSFFFIVMKKIQIFKKI